MSSERNGFGSALFTFITGAAIGAGLALLFAPRSGEETRKKILETGNQLSNDAKDSYERIAREAQKVVEQVKATSDKTLAQVKSLVEEAKAGITPEKKPTKPAAAKSPRTRTTKN